MDNVIHLQTAAPSIVTSEALRSMIRQDEEMHINALSFEAAAPIEGYEHDIWVNRMTGKKYAVRKIETVYFGLNSMPDNLVQKFISIVEREGIAKASWSVTGRTAHQMLAHKLAALLPQYDFEIEYFSYKCIARKREGK